MNEQPQRTTFFGACPHDCPDTCAMVYEVENGRLIAPEKIAVETASLRALARSSTWRV